MSVEKTLLQLNAGNANSCFVSVIVDGAVEHRMGGSQRYVLEGFLIDKLGNACPYKYSYLEKKGDKEIFKKLVHGKGIKITKPSVKTQTLEWSSSLLPKYMDITSRTSITMIPQAMLMGHPSHRVGLRRFSDIGPRMARVGAPQTVVDLTGVVIDISEIRHEKGYTFQDVTVSDQSGVAKITFSGTNLKNIIGLAERDIVTIYDLKVTKHETVQGQFTISDIKNRDSKVQKNMPSWKFTELSLMNELFSDAQSGTINTITSPYVRRGGSQPSDADVENLRAVVAVMEHTEPNASGQQMVFEVGFCVVTGIGSDPTEAMQVFCDGKCRKKKENCTCGSTAFTLRLFLPRVTIADFSASMEVLCGGEHCLALCGDCASNESFVKALEANPNYPAFRKLSALRILVKPSTDPSRASKWMASVIDVGPDSYTNPDRIEFMGKACPQNCSHGASVVPALIDDVTVDEDGNITVAGENASNVALFVIATENASIDQKDGQCIFTYKVQVKASGDMRPYTVTAHGDFDKALDYTIRKNQCAIIYTGCVDVKEKAIEASMLHILEPRTEDDWTALQANFVSTCQNASSILKAAVEVSTSEDTSMLDTLRKSPDSKRTLSFMDATPTKKTKTETQTPSTSASGTPF